MARNILDRNRFVIIAGRAGVGKTTLAQMLLLESIADGFELVVASEDARDALALWSPDPSKRQIFYYDDFLGQSTTGDKLNKNEDDRLQHLISGVSEAKNRRLILTTRSYVLEQAKQKYERLARMNLDIHKHVVKLEDYTSVNKAEILYNHIYFSDLPEDVKSSIRKDRCYMRIVHHTNYTPRLIDDISNRAVAERVSASEFPDYFISILNDPESLWQHVFDNAISREARLLLYFLASLPTTTTIQALHQAFNVAAGSESPRFNYALKEIDGDFVRIGYSDGRSVIAFANPSVRDFVLQRLLASETVAVMALDNAVFFDQVMLLLSHSKSPVSKVSFQKKAIARAMIRTFYSDRCSADNVTWIRDRTPSSYAFDRLLPLMRIGEYDEDERRWVDDAIETVCQKWEQSGAPADSHAISLVQRVLTFDEKRGYQMALAVKNQIQTSQMENIDEAEFVMDFASRFSLFSDEEFEELVTQFGEIAEAEVEAILRENHHDDVSAMHAHLSKIADDYGYEIPEHWTQQIEEHIANLEDEDRDMYGMGGGGRFEWKRLEPDGDRAIHDLFDTLDSD